MSVYNTAAPDSHEGTTGYVCACVHCVCGLCFIAFQLPASRLVSFYQDPSLLFRQENCPFSTCSLNIILLFLLLLLYHSPVILHIAIMKREREKDSCCQPAVPLAQLFSLPSPHPLLLLLHFFFLHLSFR